MILILLSLLQPPICDEGGYNIRRRKRSSDNNNLEQLGSFQALRAQDIYERDRSVEVFSGLYVSEPEDDETNGKNI